MRIFVIGNGFDLDLGLKTTYKEFFQKTDFGSRQFLEDSLGTYLNTQYRQKVIEDNWYDVEETMASYVKSKKKPISPISIEIDELHLKKLKEVFSDYVVNNWIDVSSNLWKKPIKHSLAKTLVELQSKKKCFDKIYSFNCFDYNILDLASDLEIERLSNVDYIHNHSSDFIFGIAEEDCLFEEYSFLIKKNQQGYPTKSVEQFKLDLISADEVVIFGHSLNRIDMGYFKRFFERFSKITQSLTIVTKDEKSKEVIKSNISQYAIPFETLNSNNRVSFLLTDNYYEKVNLENFDRFLSNIEKIK